MRTTEERLQQIVKDRGAGYLVLFDPDEKSVKEGSEFARTCEENGVDGLLIGGSLLFSDHFDAMVKSIRESVSIPVILFPGSGRQLSAHADAMLFISLISGRNPNFLIGEQVLSAPMVHNLKLETLPTGYMLIESGAQTSVEFMSDTRPIPREKPEIAVAHALAAQYMGMRYLYLEAGSGALKSVPEAMIQAVHSTVGLPLIVGGGIRSPEEASKKVKAGASFVVTGNVLEDLQNVKKIRKFAEAVHLR